MNDRDLLIWLHARLELVHNESPLEDYMHRLRAIIASTPDGVTSPSSDTNSLKALVRELKEEQMIKTWPKEVQEAVQVLYDYSEDWCFTLEEQEELAQMGYICHAERGYFLRFVIPKEEKK